MKVDSSKWWGWESPFVACILNFCVKFSPESLYYSLEETLVLWICLKEDTERAHFGIPDQIGYMPSHTTIETMLLRQMFL